MPNDTDPQSEESDGKASSGLSRIRHCPRCDYDLRIQIERLSSANAGGEIASPQRVHCPECGLAFDRQSCALSKKPALGCFGIMTITYFTFAIVIVASQWFGEGAVEWDELARAIMWGAFFVFGVIPILIRMHRARTRPDTLILADGLWVGGRSGELVPWSAIAEGPPPQAGEDGAPWSAPKRGENLHLVTRAEQGRKSRDILHLHDVDTDGVDAIRLIRHRMKIADATVADGS